MSIYYKISRLYYIIKTKAIISNNTLDDVEVFSLRYPEEEMLQSSHRCYRKQ